jgi:16S rRNA (guanine(527)-N(7))-methyltransferase RsmG
MAAGWDRTIAALRILGDLGFPVDSSYFFERLGRYERLCSTWNLAAKLMSKRDIENRFDEHVADSLTLLPYLIDNHQQESVTYIDIGSGGGFPAIPLLLTGITMNQVTLIERSARKAEFLRQVADQLSLSNVQIVATDFRSFQGPSGPTLYTARATEDPEKLDRRILGNLGPRDTYLAERKLPEGMDATYFAIERKTDTFTESGLRRGPLFLVRKTDIR